MKKSLFILGGIALVGTGVVAEKVIFRAPISTLYVLKGSNCLQLASSITVVSGRLNNTNTGQQATIKSDGGTTGYTLWEDNTCNSTPVYVPI